MGYDCRSSLTNPMGSSGPIGPAQCPALKQGGQNCGLHLDHHVQATLGGVVTLVSTALLRSGAVQQWPRCPAAEEMSAMHKWHVGNTPQCPLPRIRGAGGPALLSLHAQPALLCTLHHQESEHTIAFPPLSCCLLITISTFITNWNFFSFIDVHILSIPSNQIQNASRAEINTPDSTGAECSEAYLYPRYWGRWEAKAGGPPEHKCSRSAWAS